MTDSPILNVVIGSGPSGIACAKGLLDSGKKVVLIDAGNVLDSKKQEVLQLLSLEKDATLPKEFRGSLKLDSKKGAKKTAFASTYPYEGVDNHWKITQTDVVCTPSFARGGLSVVWGASLMSYAPSEVLFWPESVRNLEPYYKKILSFIPCASFDDGPAQFPLLLSNQKFNPSNQAKNIYATLEKNKKTLEERGVYFSSAKLAVSFSEGEPKKECTYCTQCLYGCPYNLIYSSNQTLKELESHPNFTYLSKRILKSIKENKDEDVLHLYFDFEGKEEVILSKKVFLACGSLLSTVLISKMLDNSNLILKDSQQFTFPCFVFKNTKNVEKERLHTLSQIYLGFFDKKVDEFSIHMQIYTYNEVVSEELKKNASFLYPFIWRILRRYVQGRLILVKGYLNSASSDEILVSLKGDEIFLNRKVNPKSRKAFKNSFLKLLGLSFKVGFFPIPFLSKITLPGNGNHYGSSYPMTKNPTRHESDILGRPFGSKNVHIVDSTTLPSICAQSITLVTMANAYRIGSIAGLGVKE